MVTAHGRLHPRSRPWLQRQKAATSASLGLLALLLVAPPMRGCSRARLPLYVAPKLHPEAAQQHQVGSWDMAACWGMGGRALACPMLRNHKSSGRRSRAALPMLQTQCVECGVTGEVCIATDRQWLCTTDVNIPLAMHQVHSPPTAVCWLQECACT